MTAEELTTPTHKEINEAQDGSSLAFKSTQVSLFVSPLDLTTQFCAARSQMPLPTTCASSLDRENSGFSV
jgi:hypothetical protein